MCRGTFYNHPEADCILYDDEYCDGDEGLKIMANGKTLYDVTSERGVQRREETDDPFSVESLSVRKGCVLEIFTGSLKLTSTLHQ